MGHRVARSAPLMRGLKPGQLWSIQSSGKFGVARSAPLMRGLKPQKSSSSESESMISRAVCPANEGIETGQCPSQC